MLNVYWEMGIASSSISGYPHLSWPGRTRLTKTRPDPPISVDMLALQPRSQLETCRVLDNTKVVDEETCRIYRLNSGST